MASSKEFVVKHGLAIGTPSNIVFNSSGVLQASATANATINITGFDIDGATDIGADLVDADLLIVDDGAGGTNRKTALSRIKKYVYSAVSGDATVSDTGALTIAATSIENSMLAGSIANDKLSNSTVSFGGVSLALGASDATPAFDLSDATNYPTSSLSGTITNTQLAGSIANSKLTNSTITVTDGSNATATALGGTITFAGTANETTVSESSGTITVGLPDNVTLASNLNVGKNVVISGNLTVSGTQTIIDTNTLNIGDNIITLNSDETGTPSQNAGIEVERGTGTNVQLRWNETADKWQITNDGSSYQNLGESELINDTTPQLGGNLDANDKKIENVNKLGVGVTSVDSANMMEVEKSGENNVVFSGNDSAIGARLVLKNKNTGSNALNQIDFSDAGGQSTSSIKGFNTDQTNNYGELGFFTRDAQGSPPAERVRIKRDGKVGIGKTSPSTALDVNGTVKATAFEGDGSALTGVPNSVSNGSNDRILTSTGGNGIQAESDFQFDGTNVFIPNEIRHIGDPDTKLGFTTDTITLTAGGVAVETLTTSGVSITGNITVSGTVDGVDIAALNTSVSGKLANIVEDTTPQLGGDLASNGNNINIADSDLIQIGTGNDLQIYHQSDVSYFKSTNASAPIRFQAPGGEVMANFIPDGAVELYHNGSKKLETTSTGATVTGAVVATTAQIGGTDGVAVSQGAISIKNGGAQSYIDFYCESSNAHYARLLAPAHADFSGNISITLPSGDDTLVGRATTDTLTNKTLTSPNITTPSISDPTVTGKADMATVQLDTIAVENPASHHTFVSTVASKTSAHPYTGQGSSSAYFLDGKESPSIVLSSNQTYRFDQSDNSNSGHPIAFYLDAAKTTAYTTGVTTNGTAGSSGAYTQIVVTDATPPCLYYQCTNHGYMGSVAGVLSKGTTDHLTEGSTNLYYTDARVDTHLNSGSASSGQILSWNGSDYAWVADQTGGGGSAITIQDEGSSLSTAASTINFVGAGVTASGTGATKTITISGGGGGSSLAIKDEGSTLSTDATTLNFVGDGVTASGTGAEKTITISGSGSTTSYTPDPIYARFILASDETFTQNTDHQVLKFTSRSADTSSGNTFTSATDGTLTVPAGVTKVKLSVGLYVVNSTDQVLVRIKRKRGSGNWLNLYGSPSPETQSTGNDYVSSHTGILDCQEGDKFAAFVYSQAGSSQYIDAGAAATYFEIQAMAGSALGGSISTSYTPKPVYAQLGLTSNHTVGTSYSAITTFNTRIKDTSTGNALTSTLGDGKFIIPAGVDKIKLRASVWVADVAGQVIMQFWKNGAIVAGTTSLDVETTGGDLPVAFTRILDVQQNDFFQVAIYAADAGTVNTNYQSRTWFELEVVEGSMLGGLGNLSTLQDVHNATPTDGQALVWDNSNSYWAPGTVGAAITVQDEGSALSTSATTLNFVGAGVTASGSGATKTITISGSGGSGGSTGIGGQFTSGTGNGSTTTFTSPVNTNLANNLIVSVDGIMQRPTTDYTVSGTTVTFGTAPPAGTAVLVRSFSGAISSKADFTVQNFTANGSNTVYKLAESITSGDHVLVSINGIIQRNTNDYTYDTGTSNITFDVAPTSGDIITFRTFDLQRNALVAISDTAPSNPRNGDLWFDSTTAKMYLRYDDGSSEQWISTTTLGQQASGSGFEYISVSSNVTMVAGKAYMVDSSSTRTLTLPASASIGDEIRIIDATGQSGTNNITVARNSHKIQGDASDLTISTNRAAFELVYFNVAQGWLLAEK